MYVSSPAKVKTKFADHNWQKQPFRESFVRCAKLFSARLKRTLPFLLCLSFLIELFSSTPGIAAAQPGKVRVLLTSLGSINRLQVGIYGAYSLDERISFQNGSNLTVSVIDKELMLYYEGMAYRAGKSVNLVRHQREGSQENGLRLLDSLALYPGDLLLTVNNGQINAVMTMPIEEYLLGVVPYEMSDDFPMEALKSQAIAARTYTLKNLKPEKPYDLVDNTNDQVFRGLDSSKTNAIAAVKDTQGLALVYQGKLAQTFYTASNGGVTESAFNAWGREHIPYLTVKEDKYDLNNPLSVAKTAKLPKDIKADLSNMIYQLMLTELKPQLAKLGYDNTPEYIRIERISDVKPYNAKDPDALGVVPNLKIEVKVSARKRMKVDQDTEVSLQATETPKTGNENKESVYTWSPMLILSESFVLELPVFPQVENALGLSINTSKNEILRVEETDKDWVLTFRRYGHGVGLSQRGAEQMAQSERWTYDKILAFYYPGCQLQKFTMANDEPPPINEVFLTTPGPIPSPTPRPTLMPQSGQPKEGQYLVRVSGIAPNSSLNLRSQPNLASEVLMRMFYGQELLVLNKLEDGWLKVKTDVIEGYVKEEFISPIDK